MSHHTMHAMRRLGNLENGRPSAVAHRAAIRLRSLMWLSGRPHSPALAANLPTVVVSSVGPMMIGPSQTRPNSTSVGPMPVDSRSKLGANSAERWPTTSELGPKSAAFGPPEPGPRLHELGRSWRRAASCGGGRLWRILALRGPRGRRLLGGSCAMWRSRVDSARLSQSIRPNIVRYRGGDRPPQT